jgi:hypothetical protein
MSLAGASKHVRVLERAGLIHRTVEGRNHICAVAPGPMADAQAWLSHYQRFWTQTLDALEGLLGAQDEAKAPPLPPRKDPKP